MNKARTIAVIIIIMAAVGLTASVSAQGPAPPLAPAGGGITASGDSINFQGRLYDSGGAPLAGITINMRFSVCGDSSCSSVVWGPTEIANVGTDHGGYFSTILGGSGSGASFNANHFTGDRWLRIEVCNAYPQNPCTSGWDVMNDPGFQPLTSVAIAVGNIRKNLPDTSTASSADYILGITNSGSGGALQGVASSGYGVYGSSSNTGVYGSGWHGMYGYSGTGGYGVYGTGTFGVWGVMGVSPDSYGVYGLSQGNSYGVYGAATGTAGIGVYGYNAANIGTLGASNTGVGVWGSASSTTADADGVFGTAATASPYRAPTGIRTGATGSVATAGDYGVFALNTAASNAFGLVGAASGTSINLPPAGASAGVVGSMTAASSYGVYGTNSNTTGQAYGVAGIASTTSINLPGAGSVGVLGSVSRSTDYGVWGYNNNASGGVGTYGYGFTGAIGYSSYSRGVFGQTDHTAADRGQAVVGYASNTTANVHGVYGVAGTGSWSVPAAPAGVAGYVNNASGMGVWGLNNSISGGHGVYGQGYYGVYGYGPNYVGALGRSDSSGGWGVVGWNWLGGVGVGAWSWSGNLIEAYQGDFPNTGNRRFHIDTLGNVYADGAFIGPSRIPSDPAGQEARYLYAMQSPEVWLEDFGRATLTKGHAEVTIEPLFAETVNLHEDYYVFLTPRGDCNGLYVTALGPASFEVRELGGGQANIAFDYRIVAKRQGYEGLRMQAVPEPEPNPAEKRPLDPEPDPPAVDVTTATAQPADAGASSSTTSPSVVQPVPAPVHRDPVKP